MPLAYIHNRSNNTLLSSSCQPPSSNLQEQQQELLSLIQFSSLGFYDAVFTLTESSPFLLCTSFNESPLRCHLRKLLRKFIPMNANLEEAATIAAEYISSELQVSIYNASEWRLRT